MPGAASIRMIARDIARNAIIRGALQKYKELYRFLMILQELCPNGIENILEIGTARGGTLWAWSKLPGSKLQIGIDMPGGQWGGGVSLEDKAKIENWINPEQETYLCLQDSHLSETLADVTRTLDGRELDLLFIDGDHTYEGVKKDFDLYSPLVRRGGIIALHDVCEHPPQTGVDVARFWLEISMKYPHRKIACYPKVWGGIGLIIKPY